MSAASGWPLGLARMSQALGRDLQRAARAAGGPERLWRADRAELGRLLRCAGAELDAAHRARARIDPAADDAWLAAAGIVHVGMDDERYPRMLRPLHDPPFGLFARGALGDVLAALEEAPVVAVVGSRRATPQGAAFARGLGAALAERGAVVVSGLAHGIDAAAHEGALDAAGVTVAVLGCGVDVAYPRRNRDLARRIREEGAVMSEYWPGTAPAPWRFPARNRARVMAMRKPAWLRWPLVTLVPLVNALCVRRCVHREPRSSGAYVPRRTTRLCDPRASRGSHAARGRAPPRARRRQFGRSPLRPRTARRAGRRWPTLGGCRIASVERAASAEPRPRTGHSSGPALEAPAVGVFNPAFARRRSSVRSRHPPLPGSPEIACM